MADTWLDNITPEQNFKVGWVDDFVIPAIGEDPVFAGQVIYWRRGRWSMVVRTTVGDRTGPGLARRQICGIKEGDA